MSTHRARFSAGAPALRRLALPALAVAVLVLVAGASLLARSDSRERVAAPPLDRQALLDALVTGPERIAPGATAYVSGPNGMWLGAAGVADLANGAPMTADARMRLESVSKIYTAALVARLEQDGLLSLEDTVERWLPVWVSGDGSRVAVLLLNGRLDGGASDAAAQQALARLYCSA